MGANRNMKMHRYIQEFSLICFVCLLALSFACNGSKDKPAPTEEETIEPVYATPVEEPEVGQVNIEELLKTWPEDIPLMEPYEVSIYTSGTNSKQLVIVVPFDLIDVDDFYIDGLKAEGWEEYEDEEPIPMVLLMTKSRKGDRNLDLKIRYDPEKEESVVIFTLTEQSESGE